MAAGGSPVDPRSVLDQQDSVSPEDQSQNFLNTLQMRVYKARVYGAVLTRDRWRRLRISLIGLLERWADLGIGTVR